MIIIIGIKDFSVPREANTSQGGKSRGLNAAVRERHKGRIFLLLLNIRGRHWNQVFCSPKRLYRS